MTTALVTGTSTGIGFTTAVSFARAGHFVFATMRNPEAGGTLREIIGAENFPVSIVALNVDDDGSVADAIAGMLKEKSQIDVLVNNAGTGSGGAVEEVPLADFRQIMETSKRVKGVRPLYGSYHDSYTAIFCHDRVGRATQT